MFTEEVRWVSVSSQPMEADDAGCDCLSSTMVGEDVMSLAELRVWN